MSCTTEKAAWMMRQSQGRHRDSRDRLRGNTLVTSLLWTVHPATNGRRWSPGLRPNPARLLPECSGCFSCQRISDTYRISAKTNFPV